MRAKGFVTVVLTLAVAASTLLSGCGGSGSAADADAATLVSMRSKLIDAQTMLELNKVSPNHYTARVGQSVRVINTRKYDLMLPTGYAGMFDSNEPFTAAAPGLIRVTTEGVGEFRTLYLDVR